MTLAPVTVDNRGMKSFCSVRTTRERPEGTSESKGRHGRPSCRRRGHPEWLRSESVRDKGRETSPRAAPKLGSNGGWLERGQKQSWRLQEKTGFLPCGLEKAELGIERDFMERLGVEWKKSQKIGRREVPGGLGTQADQLLETGRRSTTLELNRGLQKGPALVQREQQT